MTKTEFVMRPVLLLRGMPVLLGSMALVGALLGGAVVPAVQSALEVFDTANPVIVAQATLLPSGADEVLIHLVGEKRRECQYVGLQAYTRRRGAAILSDAYIRRVDSPETGATRPTGTFASLGTWRIFPRADAGVVLVYMQHACSGRLVVAKVAELTLPGGT